MEYSDNILDCEQHPASYIDNVARLVKVSKLEPVSVTFGIAEKLKAILLEREGCEFDARQLGLLIGCTRMQINSSIQTLRKATNNGMKLTVRETRLKNFYMAHKVEVRDSSLDVVKPLFSGDIETAIHRNKTIITEML